MIPARRRMAGVDAAYLRMERRTNSMVIVGVIVLAERLTLEELKRLIAERWLIHERFRAVPVEEAVGGTWVEDPYFELDAHVGTLSLPADGSQAALEQLVAELASQGLDPRRPMWRFDLVPRYGKGSAIIERIHHCYADGIALVKLILGLTTAAPGAPLAPPEPTAEDPRQADEALAPWLSALIAPAATWLGGAIAGGTSLVEAGLKQVLHPREALGEARHAAGMAAELASVAALPDDPPSPLKGPLGALKSVAWSKPLPLHEVRTVARALGCTVNDVLIAVIAGALGRYLRRRGYDTRGRTLRATLPVNLRLADEPASLGNRFGLVVLSLPIGIAHPLKRLYAVREAMQALKGSPQAAAAFVTLTALGHLPAAVETLVIDMLSGKASAVITNVPGPPRPIYLCDRLISEMHFCVPQSGTIGLGISLFSYAGELQFAVIADRGLVPSPHAIVDGFGDEFERLLLLTVLGIAHMRAPRLPRAGAARARGPGNPPQPAA
ncbi:MAG TPA: wax ester/triacylglycerol synthase family O-acyltransferase [Steroidobacteraceae bacterium]|nr:wax ester/triacylglycerol synthase family O-acyltransferase [Steroidobacteraceae bacterium]